MNYHYILAVSLIILAFIGCSKLPDCNGKNEKDSLIKALNAQLKKPSDLKTEFTTELEMYDAEFNNLIDDFTEKLVFSNVRIIAKNAEVNSCDCKVMLTLSEIEKYTKLFSKGGDATVYTNVDFIQQEKIRNGLNTSFEIQYRIQNTEDGKLHAEILDNVLNTNVEFVTALSALFSANHIYKIANNNDEKPIKLAYGKNVLEGEFKYRELTDVIREVCVGKKLVFELSDYVRFPEEEFTSEVITNEIGVYTGKSESTFDKFLGKKVIIEVNIVATDYQGVVHSTLPIYVNESDVIVKD